MISVSIKAKELGIAVCNYPTTIVEASMLGTGRDATRNILGMAHVVSSHSGRAVACRHGVGSEQFNLKPDATAVQ